MDKPDIHRLIELQQFLLLFQKIDRALFIPGRGERHENDVEHSYNLAMAGWFLTQYFPELDKDSVIRCALVHDLVEVHAGDTMIFQNPQGLATKKDREAAAVEQLKTDWADFPEMLAQLEQYESRASAEARFVYALDKLMPAIMNYLQGGRIWKTHGVTPATLGKIQLPKVSLSPEILPYYRALLDILAGQPELFTPGRKA
ncbi:MAG TPA: HD domain-containing protein [Candidatus Saccharimonadales bacterium]|nr:HD domain-containing protein [Candidatus Saccharimonadales bacterium]